MSLVLSVVHQMVIVYILMVTLSALCVMHVRQVIMKLFTITCRNMSTSKEQPKGLTNETSLKKLANSIGFSETETLYASHILQAMEFLKGSK